MDDLERLVAIDAIRDLMASPQRLTQPPPDPFKRPRGRLDQGKELP
jgi:hypothetical protein